MTRITLYLSLCLLLLTSCGNHILRLHRIPYFREKNIFTDSAGLWLRQKVSFNMPRIVDEEYRHELCIWIRDTAAFKSGLKICLPGDSAIARCTYLFASVWEGLDNRSISGYIRIKNRKPGKIKLKMNLTVDNGPDEKKLHYKGTRTFKKENKTKP
jgi:hypothetical protein